MPLALNSVKLLNTEQCKLIQLTDLYSTLTVAYSVTEVNHDLRVAQGKCCRGPTWKQFFLITPSNNVCEGIFRVTVVLKSH